MKNTKLPTASKFTVLRQVCNYIPAHLVPQLARDTGVDEQARTFSPWSHVVSLCYGQLAHSIGLNDVCDALQLNCGPLSALRGATPPTRNNLSHANKVRDAAMAEQLFWAVFKHLGELSPKFVSGKAGKRFARRFTRTIHLVDSTTIQLIANCMDWAKHRRRKAAAKCHLRLDLQSFLPRFALVTKAGDADAKRAREVCAGVQAGEIVIFDKAYLDYGHLMDLDRREVIWVTRAKERLQFEVMKNLPVAKGGKIVSDELVGVKNAASQKAYPQLLRRVTAWVEVDGKERLMVFLTNQLTWSPESVAELYRCRWQIEVFFKHLLLRYLAFLTNWAHSFSRLFAVIRTCLWRKLDLHGLLGRYGTAAGSFRYLGRPEQAFFPGFI